MAKVRCPDGKIIEEANPTALAYYGREPGYEVLSVEQPEAEPAAEPVAENVEETGAVEMPARSASKREWYDYAATVDPQLAGYEDITHDELVQRYGGQ